MLRRSPAPGIGQGVLLERGCRPSHHPVRTHAPQGLNGEAVEEVGYALGVEDDQAVGVTGIPLPLGDQVGDHAANLGLSGFGDIVVGAEPLRVE